MRTQPRLVPVALLSGALALAGASCNQILGLGDYTDDCPAVEQGKPCPKVDLCPPGEKKPCYTADPDTKDKGICHGGTKTCGSDGLFGTCDGEQTPKDKEVCGNGLDDDCNGKVDDDCPCTPGKAYVCHSGNNPTPDVGNCKSGTHVCQKDGVSFGACKGEVSPAAENYDKRGDENCDGIPSADTAWVDVLTAPGGAVVVNGVAADAKGNVYVTGQLNGTLTLGSTTLTSQSADGDGFLAKADAKGSWQRATLYPGAQFGGPFYPSNPLAYDVAGDRIIATGVTTGADFGAPDGPVPQGVFVVAFSTSGAAAWSAGCSMPASLDAVSATITIDDTGTATVGGSFKGALSCGTTHLTSASSASKSAFVAQFDPSGAPAWAMSWGDYSTTTPVDQELLGLAVAPDHGIWATGGLRGQVIIGTDSLTAAGTSGKPDVFLVKIKPTGHYTSYEHAFGDASGQEGSGITIDAHGNVYVTGYKEGALDFGGGALPSFGGDTVFVAAFDATGTPLWSQGYGGSSGNNDFGTGIIVEPNGDVILGGQVLGGINFGDGGFVSGSAAYGYLARLQPKMSGAPPATVWTKFYGGDKSDGSANVIATAMTLARRTTGEAKDVVMIGQFAQPADFGTGTVGPMQAFPNVSGFVMRVAP